MQTFAMLALCATGTVAGASVSHSVSFLQDQNAFDADMDGFITGDEFTTNGTSGGMDDGTVWAFTPINNLVGFPRLQFSEERGLQFGGGGGSVLTFDFTVSSDVFLESYTIDDSTIFILGNPAFDIREGASVLSAGNDANESGSTNAFEGGPILLEAGTSYSFVTTTTGAAIQSFMASWQYSIVPTPGAAGLLAVGGLVAVRRRR